MNVHQKPRAGILLEVDLSVRPESYYYYYYYLFTKHILFVMPMMCAEQELVVCNSWFKKNDVHKYTWLRMAEGRVVDKALMDYVLLLPRRMLGRLFDVKVWRGEGGDCLTIFWWKLG